MTPTLTFLHTAAVHTPTFERLVAAADPSIPTRHLVVEELLSDARTHGLTTALAERVATTLAEAAEGAAVIVCTCSTIGALAEAAAPLVGLPVLRVDRAMAERAIEYGPSILLAASLASTLEPTRLLLEEAAQARVLSIRGVVCEGAWDCFEAGDQAGYLDRIEESIRAAVREDRPDVIVLAQASMAGVAQCCADLGIPLLSSPALGVAAAIERYWGVRQWMVDDGR
jgi:Asp/Glu/hydantoin racemase